MAIAKLEYTNANGQTLDFMASWITPTRLIGFEGGEASHRRVESPLEDGSVYLNTRKLDMLPMIQFEIDGPDWATLQQRRRQVMEVLRPKAGLGVLAYQPDAAADEYQIEALVERRSGQDRAGAFSQIEVWTVQFRCPDPYWAVSPANTDILASSDASETVENDGDGLTYPVFSIDTDTARLGWVDLENVTTGQAVKYRVTSGSISGEFEVDMGAKSASHEGSASLPASLTSDSVFWALARGQNEIAVRAAYIVNSGVTDGGAGGAWSSASNITNMSTSSVAAWATSSTATSEGLLATDLRLNVPSGATILGIRAIVTARRASGISGSISLGEIYLWNGSATIGDNQGSQLLDGTMTDYEFGGAADDWNATLTPAVVNATGFGLLIRGSAIVVAGTFGLHVARVLVEVYYSGADGTGTDWTVTYATKVDGV